MELVDGADLYKYIHSQNEYSWGNVQDFLADMAGALAHIHAKGFVHRDVKSLNFLVSSLLIHVSAFSNVDRYHEVALLKYAILDSVVK